MNFNARMPEVAENKSIIELPPLTTEHPDNIAVASLRQKQKKFTLVLCTTIAVTLVCVWTLAVGLINALPSVRRPCFPWFTAAEITGAIGVYLGVKCYRIYEAIEKEFSEASNFVKAAKYKAEAIFFHKMKVLTLVLGIASFSAIFLFIDFRQEILSSISIAVFVICLFGYPSSWALESNYKYWYKYHKKEDKCEHCAYDSKVIGCKYDNEKCRVPDAESEI